MPKTIKIFLTSDIHSEHVQDSVDPLCDDPRLQYYYPELVDVVVLAGDIGEWTNGMQYARNRFANKEIVYVAGNHEYYDSDLSFIDDMRIKAKELGIHFLDNDSVIIGDVRFLGTTLWTNFDNYSHEAVTESARDMCDYEYIRCEKWWLNEQNREKAFRLMNIDSACSDIPKYFSPTVAYILHQEAINWLDHELNKPYLGQTVIVTHHAPSMRSSTNNIHAYASDLEKFITNNADKINLWCHGHVHKPFDYEIAGVRVTSNPRGYPSVPSILFNEGKIISL